MDKDPQQRITAQEVLEHPWMHRDSLAVHAQVRFDSLPHNGLCFLWSPLECWANGFGFKLYVQCDLRQSLAVLRDYRDGVDGGLHTATDWEVEANIPE